jgi:hypothetical protein
MTPDEQEMVLSLAVVPNGGPPADPNDVLQRLGASDGQELGARLLREALEHADGVDVEMALIITSVFGVSDDHLAPLLVLAATEWHESHEDVVTALSRLKDPKSVDVLRNLVEWVPGYLDWDDSRALAVKAIHALGKIPGEPSERALASLLNSDSEIVRDRASRQLAGRQR